LDFRLLETLSSEQPGIHQIFPTLAEVILADGKASSKRKIKGKKVGITNVARSVGHPQNTGVATHREHEPRCGTPPPRLATHGAMGWSRDGARDLQTSINQTNALHSQLGDPVAKLT